MSALVPRALMGQRMMYRNWYACLPVMVLQCSQAIPDHIGVTIDAIKNSVHVHSPVLVEVLE